MTNTGGAQISAIRAQEDALAKDTAELSDYAARIAEVDRRVEALYAVMGPEKPVTLTDMFQMQLATDELNQLSEMNSAVVAQTQSDLDALARAEKG